MKKIVTLFVLLLLAKGLAFTQCNQTLVTNCCNTLPAYATYLHEYRAKLPAASEKNNLPVARFSVLLTKGNIYHFSVCSALDFEGEAILQLFDGSYQVANSYDPKTKTNYRQFEFSCNKTAIYKIYISFLDGKPGCAVGVLALKKK